MRSLLRLYLEYMKAAGLAMLWAAVMLGTYAFIRSSSVVGTVVAALVSLLLSFVVLFTVLDYLSPSHKVRKAVAGALGAAAALLLKPESQAGQKQRV